MDGNGWYDILISMKKLTHFEVMFFYRYPELEVGRIDLYLFNPPFSAETDFGRHARFWRLKSVPTFKEQNIYIGRIKPIT